VLDRLAQLGRQPLGLRALCRDHAQTGAFA
jgi:hypothetical protein